ncbi:hypothetical protein H257_10443 [Aphanomyces astaci]|uniref:Uncharacterized protein n=1 Tax=Aphanomyces astaci TaxID=112090 RepID=W4G7J1_APHAT|nr:hypothetical protein H257_10443 [Aphanomyces astaci]ETV75251.1 hypothetical protein H257_10443 [Aphanomyces astaci]|eukprot:XP_009835299.1 hypothetical protein H257_10443 [Aphanomyces astaci]
MSLNSTSAPSFVGTPLDESRPLAYATWKTDFLPQATIRDIMWYFTKPNHVPFEIRREALKISKEYLEVDEVDSPDFYYIDPSSETDRAARMADIKMRTSAILAKAMNRESPKALSAQRSFAHTFLVSGISTNLRYLYHTTTCPYVLFELLTFRFESNAMNNNPTLTDDSSFDTLAEELNDLVKRYPSSMTPPTFNPLDASSISSTTATTFGPITLCVPCPSHLLRTRTSGKSSRTMFRLPELPVRLSLLTMFGLPSALSSTIVPNVLLLWVTSALPSLPQLALRTRPLRMPLRPHTAAPGIQPA